MLSSVWRRSLALMLLVFLVTIPARADNGEYKPPEAGRKPPSVTPPKSNPVPTGAPLTETPRPVGVPTPGSLTPRVGTPTAESTGRSAAISWEVAWELLRREILEPSRSSSAEARERATSALVAALTDDSLEVRSEAALALGRMGVYRPVADAIRSDIELAGTTGLLGPGIAAKRSGVDGFEPTLWEVYGPILENEDGPVFSKALAALGLSLGGANSASALLGTLEKAPDPAVARALYFSLGLTGHPGVRDILVDRVLPGDARGKDDPAGRALLTSGLSFVSGEDTRTDLTRRLGDRSEMVKRAAILSLGGDLRSRSALLSIAASGPPGPRSAALLALAREGERKAADSATRVLADPLGRGTDLAPVAALVLGMLGERGEELLDLAGDKLAPTELRAAAAVAAGLTRERGTGEQFREVIASAKDARLRAFMHLGRALVDGEKAVPGIARLLASEKRPLVRRIAVVALGYAGGEEAIELLVAALGDTYFVNREAAEALYRLDPDLAVRELLKLLGDEANPFARRFGAYALGRVLGGGEPQPFSEGLWRAGLGLGTGLERLFLHLESEYLRKLLFG